MGEWVGWCVGAWVILMSTPGPFPLKGEMFLTCVADLGGTSVPDLELDNNCCCSDHIINWPLWMTRHRL